MKEYTAKEMKPYTFKVTKNKLYFKADFKEKFVIGYLGRECPKKVAGTYGI